jgi:hypothetical protein
VIGSFRYLMLDAKALVDMKAIWRSRVDGLAPSVWKLGLGFSHAPVYAGRSSLPHQGYPYSA